jgi:hypothetical protein
MVKNQNSKNLNVMVYPQYADALDKMLVERKTELAELGILNSSDYILWLIGEDAAAKGYELPLAKAPHGVRADSSVYPKAEQEGD